MDLSQAPAFVAAKMAMLSDACATAATRADEVTAQISQLRDRLNGRVQRAGDDPIKLGIEIDRALAEQKALQARRPIDIGIIESCKAWLDGLPVGTKLEPVAVNADGHDLIEVRKRIKAANAELEALRRAPAPSEDIEARVRNYVRGLAPKVRGVGVGERLSIVWPGAQGGTQYISEHTCDPLALVAALFPERMLALVMGEVARQADDPLPVAQRAPRIAALAQELSDLHLVEEILVAAAIAAGQPVHRSPTAPPAAVLGVRVADNVSRAA
jgi:hypothetical protein